MHKVPNLFDGLHDGKYQLSTAPAGTQFFIDLHQFINKLRSIPQQCLYNNRYTTVFNWTIPWPDKCLLV